MEEAPIVSGLLYKRRGGFGKMMPHSWQQRFFKITKDGFLCYFDNDCPEGIRNLSEGKLRGKIDLHEVQYDFTDDNALESGAPTSYLIQLTPLHDEKWKLCASNKEEFLKWSKAIQDICDKKEYPRRNGLVIDAYVSDAEEEKVEVPDKKVVKPLGPNISKNRLKLKTNTSHSLFDMIELFLTLLIMNFCFYLAYYSDFKGKIIYIAIANFITGKTLIQRNSRTIVSDKHVHQVSSKEQTNTKADTPSNSLTVAEKRTSKLFRPIPGQTYPEVQSLPKNSPPHTWCRCDSKQFQVRIGPDYSRNKKKAASAPALYDPFAVDVFCTKTRIDQAARLFDIPREYLNIDTHHPHVPPVFVVQMQIPSEPPPSLFTTVEDGPGWAILMFFKITEDTLSQLKDFNNASPAVKLFAQYCEKSSDDPQWRARFKVICSCSNLEEMGAPQFIMSYNAKPVLIRRTGSDFKGKGYIEKNIHVHKFATLAKQSIHSLSSRCGLMYMQIGFVVEGRTDDELPETIFACVAINKPQEDLAGFLFEDKEI